MSNQVQRELLRLADAVESTLSTLACVKPAPPEKLVVADAIRSLRQRVALLQEGLPARLTPEYQRWLPELCRIERDLVAALASPSNLAGRRARLATFDDNVAEVEFHVEWLERSFTGVPAAN